MFCTKARNWISLAHDGRLPAEKTLALEEHLVRCAECRAYREDLETASRLLKATTPEPSEAFEWNLQLRMNNVLREAAATDEAPWRAPRSSFGWLRGFAVSSAAGLAATVALFLVFSPGLRMSPVTADPTAGSPIAGVASRSLASADEYAPRLSTVGRSAGDADRLPLSLFNGRRPSGFDFSSGQPVSTSRFASTPRSLRSFSQRSEADIETITRLARENARLRAALNRLQGRPGFDAALNDSTNSALLESVDGSD